MRETKFIEQNKDKWLEFEATLKQKRNDPDKLSKLFVQVTDDLSYARTFYPSRSVRLYLNGLAQQVFFRIYKNRRSNLKQLLSFWADELPKIVYDTRRTFLLSFAIFWLAFAIGALSTHNDPDFARLILGSNYVEMTLQNIKDGNPMGVYKDPHQTEMFLQITTNNLRVDLYTFVLGLLASLGSVLIMIQNGIMVGCFQQFFIDRGLVAQSFLTVWIHGTLEISTIIISGAAGITLGSGLVFPGTYSRMQAFRLSARRGLKIMMGVIPITITAGFLEGFMTRHTNSPAILRLTIILLSLLFILGYFVYYPWRKSKRGFNTKLLEENLPEQNNEPIQLNQIRSIGEIFTDLFRLYFLYVKRILLYGGAFTVVYTIFFFLVAQQYIMYSYYGADNFIFRYLNEMSSYFVPTANNVKELAIFIITFFTVLHLVVLSCIKHFVQLQSGAETNLAITMRKMLRSKVHILLAIAALPTILAFNTSEYNALFLLIGYPIVSLFMICNLVEDKPIADAIAFTIQSLRSFFGVYLLLIIVFLFSVMLLGSPLSWILFELLKMNFNLSVAGFQSLYAIFFTLLNIMGLFMSLPVILFGTGLYFYSQREIQEAIGLQQQIDKIGTKSKLYGLEQEI